MTAISGHKTESIHVPPRRINEIVVGKRGVTADTALRLARFFGTSVESWMTVQARYEVERAQDVLSDELAAIEPVRTVAWCRLAYAMVIMYI